MAACATPTMFPSFSSPSLTSIQPRYSATNLVCTEGVTCVAGIKSLFSIFSEPISSSLNVACKGRLERVRGREGEGEGEGG